MHLILFVIYAPPQQKSNYKDRFLKTATFFVSCPYFDNINDNLIIKLIEIAVPEYYISK